MALNVCVYVSNPYQLEMRHHKCAPPLVLVVMVSFGDEIWFDASDIVRCELSFSGAAGSFGGALVPYRTVPYLD